MKNINKLDRRTPQKHPNAMATGVKASESLCAFWFSPNTVDMARVSGDTLDAILVEMSDVVADTVE